MRIENLHADDLGVAYSASPLECAMSINNLALLYIQQSRFTDAEIMYTMPSLPPTTNCDIMKSGTTRLCGCESKNMGMMT